MTAERCGLGSLLPVSCRGRAEAFARRLQSRLRSLGRGADDEDAGPSSGHVGDEDYEELLEPDSSWRTSQSGTMQEKQPIVSPDNSDHYFDFDLDISSPGSPNTEELTVVNRDHLVDRKCCESGCVLSSPTNPDADSDSSDGQYFDPMWTDTCTDSASNSCPLHVSKATSRTECDSCHFNRQSDHHNISSCSNGTFYFTPVSFQSSFTLPSSTSDSTNASTSSSNRRRCPSDCSCPARGPHQSLCRHNFSSSGKTCHHLNLHSSQLSFPPESSDLLSLQSPMSNFVSSDISPVADVPPPSPDSGDSDSPSTSQTSLVPVTDIQSCDETISRPLHKSPAVQSLPSLERRCVEEGEAAELRDCVRALCSEIIALAEAEVLSRTQNSREVENEEPCTASVCETEEPEGICRSEDHDGELCRNILTCETSSQESSTDTPSPEIQDEEACAIPGCETAGGICRSEDHDDELCRNTLTCETSSQESSTDTPSPEIQDEEVCVVCAIPACETEEPEGICRSEDHDDKLCRNTLTCETSSQESSTDTPSPEIQDEEACAIPACETEPEEPFEDVDSDTRVERAFTATSLETEQSDEDDEILEIHQEGDECAPTVVISRADSLSPIKLSSRYENDLVKSKEEINTLFDSIPLKSPDTNASSDSSSRISTPEDEKPRRVQRSSSLKTGKTPPGTPGRKKIVRFADVLGLDLADVRTFLDEIPKVPSCAFWDLSVEQKQGAGDYFAAPHHIAAPTKCLVPMFQQPGGSPEFMDKVRLNKVCLENAFQGDELSITGTVRVLNMDFNKTVYIRYTLDNWENFADLQASYVPGSSDGFSDKFSFVLYAHTLDVGQRVEFAVRYSALGQLFWDSNGGINYSFQCLNSTVSSVQSNFTPVKETTTSTPSATHDVHDGWASFY